MHIAEASELIRTDKISSLPNQIWCDLGCGAGTFTLALATLLPPGSVIHAIDKDERALEKIPDQYRDVTIHKQVLNLEESEFQLPEVDGILMANLLHYIESQENFVRKLSMLTRRWLIVEYENRKVSQWVPFPVSFSDLSAMMRRQGFTEIIKVGMRPSRFGGELYSALAR